MGVRRASDDRGQVEGEQSHGGGDGWVIREALDVIAGPVVVVAHSYAGIPVTQATADSPNVVHLVYIASYLPEVGEGMLPIHGAPAPDSLAGVRHPENPDYNQPASFYDGDATNPETAEAISRLVPQTVRADFETVTRAAWHTVPNSYVIPDQDVSVVATVSAWPPGRTRSTTARVAMPRSTHIPRSSPPCSPRSRSGLNG